jgi:hypothetical protein
MTIGSCSAMARPAESRPRKVDTDSKPADQMRPIARKPSTKAA